MDEHVMSEASAVYKHVILSYLVLIGHTEELTAFHLKLLDVIDQKAEDNLYRSRDELAMQAFALARKVAGHTYAWLGVEATKEREPRLENVKLRFWTKITQIDETPDLERCQAARMILQALNMALQEAGAVTSTVYPDLGKLKL